MTQHYVGTKILQAWPADRLIAEGGSRPGYGVKYADGYTSWSPKEKFEATYLAIGQLGHLPAHVLRLVAELEQLDDRISKLGKYQATDIYASLPEEERKDLAAQVECMVGYRIALLSRVSRARGQYERLALGEADSQNEKGPA